MTWAPALITSVSDGQDDKTFLHIDVLEIVHIFTTLLAMLLTGSTLGDHT